MFEKLEVYDNEERKDKIFPLIRSLTYEKKFELFFNFLLTAVALLFWRFVNSLLKSILERGIVYGIAVEPVITAPMSMFIRLFGLFFLRWIL